MKSTNHSQRSSWLVFILAAGAAMAFALYTRHAWEDYYITFRTSKNLVLGNGLVFTAGERVHSFTSPLGVLLPALASWMTGTHADDAALWVFRAMGATALAGAAALLYGGMRRLGGGRIAAWLAAGFVALDAKSLDFSTNGMETGFLLLFLAYAFWALTAPSPRQSRHLGAAWAGIMWTRPDGFIYIGLLGGSYWVFNYFAASRQDRRESFGLLLKATLICTLLYLPWFVWAWTYYGSPIPHTIIAKGSMNPGRTLAGFLQTFVLLPFRLWTGETAVEGALMPTYYQAAGWSAVFHVTARILGAVAVVAWCWPRLRPATRAASFTFHGAVAYLSYFPYFPFPWYFPATCILGAMVWSGVADQLLAPRPTPPDRPRGRLGRYLVYGVAAWVLGVETVLTLASAVQMKAKQQIVYTGNLRRIGEWLRQHARPTDHVFMEPLGYIGYFSQLRAYDYPGLSSPRMVEARKSGNGWGGLLLALVPEWVVLRAPEAGRITQEAPDVLTKYFQPVQVFDVRPQAAAARVPDHFMLDFDANFTVYRRAYVTFEDEEILGVQHQFGTDTTIRSIDGTRVRLVHASGTMSLRVPPGSSRFEVRFGFPTDAYETEPRTDGATFSVVWADGPATTTLAVRTLDPAAHPADRGLQVFAGELPPSTSGHARLLLHTHSGKTTTKDWTCWGICVFR